VALALAVPSGTPPHWLLLALFFLLCMWVALWVSASLGWRSTSAPMVRGHRQDRRA
jgi:hypothetical protein